ncbi:hypothetical protein PHYBOEH_007769 [Phytophthora boehmeriae]|uniref:C2H2-type domain-containing protein n=1 Tax=Phytophthora boehmeriae TaxID=109152 RepID=A0A8T1W7J3_9STRA|nr:hypothetical protein PHYBOEH_007769 [Phytophthora boehmeriae]
MAQQDGAPMTALNDVSNPSSAATDPHEASPSSSDPQHRVLTVGDGNFSYSLALAKRFKARGKPLQLAATSFDSYQELVGKYPESERICAQLKEVGATLLHRVDATNLRESMTGQEQKLRLEFDAVVFNHPHCGEENVKRHQSLLSHFYASALEVLDPTSQDEDRGIYLTLAEGQPERWQALQRAEKAGLKLFKQVQDVDNDERFGVGYERKRHQNGKSFHLVTLHGEKKQQTSTLFIFRRRREDEKADVDAAPVLTEEKKAVVSRKRKAEKELPLEFACDQCERSFKSAQGLRTHVHMVHELEGTAPTRALLPCSFCDRTFKKEDARRQHQLAKHGKDPLIKPDWYEQQQLANEKTSAQPAEMASSEAKTSQEQPVPPTTTTTLAKMCDICQHSFASDGEFDAHWQKLQPRSSSKRKCSTCSREFDEERALRQHQNFCGISS